jgi:hypothetical protein
MKANEIRACDLCGNGLMGAGHITFHRVTFERMGIDLNAVRQRQGLHTLLGNAALAEVFAPTSDVAVRIGDADSLIICEDCAMKPHVPMVLLERAARRAEAKEPA